MLQSYSKFYNDQLKELENNLISCKVDLANKLSLMDEYQNNLNKLKKKLISILKNHKISFDTKATPRKFHKATAKKNKRSLSENILNFEEKKKINQRIMSFDFKNENGCDIKESIFYYKMTLLQMAQKYSLVLKDEEESKTIEENKKTSLNNESKSNKTKSKTIAIIINNFRRSPSILLKPQHNFNDLTDLRTNQIDVEIWSKNILQMVRSKQNREKTIKEIQNLLKKSYIPSKLRGIIWPFV